MNDNKNQIARCITDARNILLTSHVNIDGDGAGTMLAMARAMRNAGKKATIILPDKQANHYNWLLANEPVAYPDQFKELATTADLILVADTCSFSQLGELAPLLRLHREKIVVIDHHATHDDLTAIKYIDPSAAATGLMALELVKTLNWPLTTEIAEPLAVAILTDTGWLRFSNTDSRCLQSMAELLEYQVNIDILYRHIFQSDRVEKLRLTAASLNSLQLHCNNQLATMVLTTRDFEMTGARENETENLVNEALRINTVEVAAIFIENDEVTRVSLRSRKRVDVSAIAASFGGGGHVRAAGFKHPKSPGDLIPLVITAIDAQLQ